MSGQRVDRSRQPRSIPSSRPVVRHADIQGHWFPGGVGTQLSNLAMIEEHPGGFGFEAGKSLVIDPADGTIPYQPWALAERNRQRRGENAYEDPSARCEPLGPTRAVNFDLYFIYTRADIVIVSGASSQIAFDNRVIHMDGRRHLPERIRLWMGDSLGHWENSTLVIETTNFARRMWMATAGDFYSEAAKIVERFTMTDANTMTWQATITDPTVYTRPWTIQPPWGFYRDREDQEAFEDTCHQGNEDLSHLKTLYDAAHTNENK